MRNLFFIFSFIAIVAAGLILYFVPKLWWINLFTLPVVLIGVYDMIQKKHAIMRNFPLFGRGRYVLEDLRPKLYQYFIESDTNGRPLSRISRSVVYQRAKDVLDTTPFGTQLDVYQEGYEWMNHSIGALDAHKLDQDPRVKVGGPLCQQPYEASIFNISAMSYGSLSKNAIEALNGGASAGGFAHNTGEGGISPYHEKYQGDLIYQIGTGYFGCRAEDGDFSPELFSKISQRPSVKMIELKLSQGAKPGHGGILPAKKNTAEIAKIRNVEPGTAVLSPPFHKAFNTPKGLLEFLNEMRVLSNGKPVGFKLCVGRKSEFIAICKAMIETKLYPDFIAVDGGEGGTGAAPLEFSNAVGAPYKEGLAFVYDALVGFGLKKHIKLFASGKILTGFDMFKAFALGADACYSARGMMLALGCIQALECNKNSCPTGVATQKPELVQGLVVADKKFRVASYHHETVKSFIELLAAAGLDHQDKINRHQVFRRLDLNQSRPFSEIFPYIPVGALLEEESVPKNWLRDWKEARTDTFVSSIY
ncbi:MAG: FMN-binding glutamate synthase family protein [Bacteroidota bacterium]